jgi:DNA-directed RNA polymerase specialized sigma24 family protein
VTFDTTHWSVVSALRSDDSVVARQALATLYEKYWDPIYEHVCWWGYRADDAQDVTQEFFTTIIERHSLEAARPEGGLFRMFLRHALKHFLMDADKHRRRLKRGGGQPALSLDADTVDGRPIPEPIDYDTPERVFDQQWAQAVHDRALKRLEHEWIEAGDSAAFELLRRSFQGDLPSVGHREVARTLTITEDAVKAMAKRLKHRFQRLLRKEVAATLRVPTKHAIDAELRHLAKSLRR